jgi:hypothetical protein
MVHRVALLILLLSSSLAARAADALDPWISPGPGGEPRVQLYFFWSASCPHCTRALPFVEDLPGQLPWLDLHSIRIGGDKEQVRRFIALAALAGAEASAVPAFIFCGQHLSGYDDAEGMGAVLRDGLEACHRRVAQAGSDPAAADMDGPLLQVPVLGEVVPEAWSLPLLTISLAALDSFNPCAFFVLLFLLSLLVNTRDRGRMLLIGGVFVAISGAVYFVFLAAWLNLFLVAGELRWITLAAGLVAMLIGVLNVKDFAWPGRGPSLRIPEQARPGLYRRMRELVGMRRAGPALAATVLLALVANSYELLCTAGFPMVFTRVLTLQDLPQAAHYAYIALYSLVYVAPLLLIVVLFVHTLGKRKLQAHEGRALKLLSGLMMLGLGVTLVLAPQAMTRPLLGAGLVGSAVLVTLLVLVLERKRAIG